MTDDPAVLAAEYMRLRAEITTLETAAEEIRTRLKGTLLGEATEPPPGGWVYGPITVHYVKGSERPSLNRKKLVQQGVTLDQILAATDYTKVAPTIRVVATKEGE